MYRISKITEIGVNVSDINSMFAYVGEGVDEVEIVSDFSIQTGEYTNEVNVIFKQPTQGDISMNTWLKLKEHVKIQLNVDFYIKSFDIVPTQNKLILVFDTQCPIVEL